MRVEGRVDELRLRPEHAADRLAEVGVHPDDRVAVGADELVRRVRGVGRDDERPRRRCGPPSVAGSGAGREHERGREDEGERCGK